MTTVSNHNQLRPSVPGEPNRAGVNGPIGITDEIAYVAAGGAPIPRLATHRAALELKHAYAEFRGFVYHSDVVRLRGRVTAPVCRPTAVVDVTTQATNQRGADVMPDHATIALPSQELKQAPVARRMTERPPVRGS